MNLPRPRVAANFALTWDGKTTTRTHSPTTYTSQADKKRLREIRAGADAVLAGAATVAADTMTMGISDPALRKARVARGLPPEPLRVIVSASGRLDPRSRVFAHRGSPVVIFSGKRPRCTHRLPDFCDVHILPGGPSLRLALALLHADYAVQKVVCEGGPRLLFSLLQDDLVDEIFLTFVPRIFGGHQAPTLTGLPGDWLPSPLQFQLVSSQKVDGELHSHWIRNSGKKLQSMPRKR